jgi:L-amino acid N-acyltransferase YncA
MVDAMTDPIIKNSSKADVASLHSIYTHEVLCGLASFEECPPSLDEFSARRRNVLELGLPFLVAECDGSAVGYAYANQYRSRAAYRNSVEDSVYVAPAFHGQGVGKKLLSALIQECAGGPWRQMIAVIGNSGNTGSIALHRKLGFREVGTLLAVGFKLGQWVDTVIMQRPLGPGAIGRL